ncbi:MAG: RNA chaperone Hfq [Acidobacteria bacterium]|nr:RNA chaperone Hfq [Acidobacteriota bacterium]
MRAAAASGYHGYSHGEPPQFTYRRSRTPTTSKSPRPAEQTFEEPKYLKRLIESATPVRVKMVDGEEVVGVIEYYDQRFIRVTREGEPNLFIFKHDIKYLSEEA